MAPITRTQALIDLAAAMAITLFGGLAAGMTAAALRDFVALPLALVLIIQGLIVLAGLDALLRWRGQSWQALGLVALRLKDLGRALLALLLVFLVNAVVVTIASWLVPEQVHAHQERLSEVGDMLMSDLPLTLLAATMLFIGLYEELLARGFLLERCRVLFGGAAAPVLVSSLLFGIGHFYQGWGGVLQTTIVGIVFAVLVLRWHTLWPVILAHAGLNTISLILLHDLAASG